MEKNRPVPQRPIIIIPARMASTRLPGKPLLDMGGLPMILQVWKRALESDIGPVAVACDGEEIASVVRDAGGEVVVTDPALPSGSDRIWEALHKLQQAKGGNGFDAILNVQGDLPTLDPAIIKAAFELLKTPAVDIGTLGAAIVDDKDKLASHIVKAAVEISDRQTHGRALYFSRNPIPSGDGPLYHHIGLYAYRRDALARFVKEPPSQLERREKLEQLRALALGMRIEVAIVKTVPLGVDTPADLEIARQLLGRS